MVCLTISACGATQCFSKCLNGKLMLAMAMAKCLHRVKQMEARKICEITSKWCLLQHAHLELLHQPIGMFQMQLKLMKQHPTLILVPYSL